MAVEQPDMEVTESKRGLWISLAVAAVVVIAVVVWMLQEPEPRNQPEPEQPLPELNTPTVEPEPEPEPEPDMPAPTPAPDMAPTVAPQPEPALELPPLGQSNALVLERADAASLNTRPVASRNVIRDLVVFVDNARQGLAATDHAVVARPDGRFAVIELDQKLYIDERSFARYDAISTWFASMEPAALVALFEDFEPLFNEAFAEIGYPDGNFDQALLEAIDVALATPEVEGMIEVTDESVMYRFADARLESLPPIQKQLLRTGLANVLKIKAQLRDLKALLLAR